MSKTGRVKEISSSGEVDSRKFNCGIDGGKGEKLKKISILCVQETRWTGKSAKELGGSVSYVKAE